MKPFLLSLAVACVTLLASCESEPSTAPFDYPGFYPTNYELSVLQMASRFADSSSLIREVTAEFRTDRNTSIAVPLVTYNGMVVPKRGGDTLAYRKLDVPIPAPGMPQLWRVEGTAALPSLVDSSSWFATETQITAPRVSDTISLSRGFQLRWSTAAADSAKAIYSVGDGAREIFEVAVADVGAAAVTPERLRASNVQPGRLTIAVARLRETSYFSQGKRVVTRRLWSVESIALQAVQ